jgi:hypothetical protein
MNRRIARAWSVSALGLLITNLPLACVTPPPPSVAAPGARETNVAHTEEIGGPKAPGQCMSEGQVQQVVSLHRATISHSCWVGNQTGKATVNVSLSMTIGPDGILQNLSATGDESSVVKCVENDVRSWRFPALGCSQKVAIPFQFTRR